MTDAPAGSGTAGRDLTGRQLAGAFLVFVALGLLLTGQVWQDPGNRWIGICCDQEQSMWFLSWFPTAVGLGQNPLLTDRLNAPAGANLMWNASSPLVALLVSPITRTAGPILAYNVAALVVIALSGLMAFAALRRYAVRPIGPLVGGALYALSPYVASHAVLHLNLISAWGPPAFLLLLDELLLRDRRRPAVLGAILGLVGGLQLLTSEEVLATCAVAGAVLLLVLALVVRDRVRIATAASRAARAIGPGLAAFLVVAGLPLGVQFLGPQQIHGRVQDTSVFSTDLLNLVLPTKYQLIAPDAVTGVSSQFSGLYHEATGYVGLPLLAVLAWIVIGRRRDPITVVSGVMAAVMFVLSLGPELHVGGQALGVPMPWLPAASLPLLEHALPVRLTLYMWLAIAVLVVVGIDGAATTSGRGRATRLATIGLALVFVVPAQLPWSSTQIPAFFRSWEAQGIGDDETILFAPWFTNGAGADPMLWAAVANARPRMVEGYVYVPGPDGRPRYGPEPGVLAKQMMDIQDHGVPPSLDAVAVTEARRELTAAGVSVVIVGPMPHRDLMVEFLGDLLGATPVEVAGVQVWRGVPDLLSRLHGTAGS